METPTKVGAAIANRPVIKPPHSFDNSLPSKNAGMSPRPTMMTGASFAVSMNVIVDMKSERNW